MRRSLVSTLLLLAPCAVHAAGWPTAGHDARRTGQSDVAGPRSPTAVETFVATGEQSINVPATIAADGRLFFGTWGVVRSFGSDDRTRWAKYDGKVFALDPSLASAWISGGHRVPYCYSYPGRAATPGFCPEGGTLHGYNGTFEGTGALSADGGVLYFGRGDGKLYAFDVATGEELWAFSTFNPRDRADPDGGGEVVAGPLVAPDGTIYFASVAAGPYESNAVYAVTPDGHLRWRYPALQKSRRNTFWAAPALSPDGKTLYVAAAWGPHAAQWDIRIPGAVLAFDLAKRSGTGDQRLKWEYRPVNAGEWWKPAVWPTRLAVGSDGTIYAAGPEFTLGGGTAVVFALRDRGQRAELAWPRMVAVDRGRAALSLGLALREAGGVTRRVYVTSGNVYTPGGYKAGGKLVALHPKTGAALWAKPFDPEEHGGTGSMTGIALDKSGVIYTGVSGRNDGGRVFAIGEDGRLLWQRTVGGLLEWAQPVLGPDGALYVADTRRCALAFLPLESGACAGVSLDPTLYRFSP